jgi:hypothetical protein
MSDPSSTYYFKNDGLVQGPVHLETLRHRAAMGEVDGHTLISRSEDEPGVSADQLQELELEWQIKDEAGNTWPVCHILALRSKVESEEIQPFWDVIHLPTGEDYQVVDALCSALLAQNKVLEDKLRKAGLPQDQPLLPEAEDDADPRELRMRRDQAQRDATKWKRLYDDEISRNKAREQELLEQIEELRSWQRKASERIKSLERRRTQLEELMLKTPSQDGNEDRDLDRAYRELQLQMEHLIDSVHLRANQLEDEREQNRELSLTLTKERHEHVSLLEEKESLQTETLEQLSKLEQAHTDLIRSYRDLNDRYIRMRNQTQSGTQPAEPTPAKPSPQPAPSSKLKMT